MSIPTTLFKHHPFKLVQPWPFSETSRPELEWPFIMIHILWPHWPWPSFHDPVPQISSAVTKSVENHQLGRFQQESLLKLSQYVSNYSALGTTQADVTLIPKVIEPTTSEIEPPLLRSDLWTIAAALVRYSCFTWVECMNKFIWITSLFLYLFAF